MTTAASDRDVVLARLRRERDERGGSGMTAGVIAAGLIDWPGSSVETTNRVNDALRELEADGLATVNWALADREDLWRATAAA